MSLTTVLPSIFSVYLLLLFSGNNWVLPTNLHVKTLEVHGHMLVVTLLSLEYNERNYDLHICTCEKKNSQIFPECLIQFLIAII
jgi:hypothetical protein